MATSVHIHRLHSRNSSSPYQSRQVDSSMSRPSLRSVSRETQRRRGAYRRAPPAPRLRSPQTNPALMLQPAHRRMWNRMRKVRSSAVLAIRSSARRRSVAYSKAELSASACAIPGASCSSTSNRFAHGDRPGFFCPNYRRTDDNTCRLQTTSPCIKRWWLASTAARS